MRDKKSRWATSSRIGHGSGLFASLQKGQEFNSAHATANRKTASDNHPMELISKQESNIRIKRESFKAYRIKREKGWEGLYGGGKIPV